MTWYLPLQLLDDLLAPFQSHLLGLVQPATHVFDLSLQTFLHPLQVEGVLLLQTQLLPNSGQLKELHHLLKPLNKCHTSAAVISQVRSFYLTAGLLGLLCGSSQLPEQLLMLLLQCLEIHLQLPPPTQSRLELNTQKHMRGKSSVRFFNEASAGPQSKETPRVTWLLRSLYFSLPSCSSVSRAFLALSALSRAARVSSPSPTNRAQRRSMAACSSLRSSWLRTSSSS